MYVYTIQKKKNVLNLLNSRNTLIIINKHYLNVDVNEQINFYNLISYLTYNCFEKFYDVQSF